LKVADWCSYGSVLSEQNGFRVDGSRGPGALLAREVTQEGLAAAALVDVMLQVRVSRC
jgi:hypothetical protein